MVAVVGVTYIGRSLVPKLARLWFLLLFAVCVLLLCPSTYYGAEHLSTQFWGLVVVVADAQRADAGLGFVLCV